ncbi:hypothetical protein GOICGAJE_03326 [Bacillus sp. MB95]|nr:hypothetical protein [Bacillus sp. MB95]
MLPILENKVRYSRCLKKYINKIKPLRGGEWDSSAKEIKILKKQIRSQLMKYQNFQCAYCGLKLGETSGDEIEHIAPKGGKSRPKHTMFTFTPYNLVLACHLCNGPVKKGTKDTIIKWDINYKNCEFNIFHPYFDNPAEHFEWIPKGYNVVIQHKTEKGKNSIKMFKLDNSAHLEARAKEVAYRLLKRRAENQAEQLIQEILNYRGE